MEDKLVQLERQLNQLSNLSDDPDIDRAIEQTNHLLRQANNQLLYKASLRPLIQDIDIQELLFSIEVGIQQLENTFNQAELEGLLLKSLIIYNEITILQEDPILTNEHIGQLLSELGLKPFNSIFEVNTIFFYDILRLVFPF